MKETFDKNVQSIIDIWQGPNPFKLADVLLQGSLIKFDQDIWVLQLLDKTYGYCYSIFLEKGRKTVQHHLTNWFHTFHKTFEGSKENDSVEDRTSHPGVFCVCVCVYVHPPWRLHLSGVGSPGYRSTMLCWRRYFPLPSSFNDTSVWITKPF